MTQAISDGALDAFLQCWFTGMGKTGALDAQQISRFRGKLMNALDAMHEAEGHFCNLNNSSTAVRDGNGAAPWRSVVKPTHRHGFG